MHFQKSQKRDNIFWQDNTYQFMTNHLYRLEPLWHHTRKYMRKRGFHTHIFFSRAFTRVKHFQMLLSNVKNSCEKTSCLYVEQANMFASSCFTFSFKNVFLRRKTFHEENQAKNAKQIVHEKESIIWRTTTMCFSVHEFFSATASVHIRVLLLLEDIQVHTRLLGRYGHSHVQLHMNNGNTRHHLHSSP